MLAHLFIFLALTVQADASIFHNPFHRKAKPAPHIPLTMDSDIDVSEGVKLSLVQEYIVAYQNVRGSLHKFRDDEKRGELEVAEIAAVQNDLDAMAKIEDPEHDATLYVLAEQLADDVDELVALDDSLGVLTYVSFRKPKANRQWDTELRYIRSALLNTVVDPNDHWLIESRVAYYRAIDDYENYLGGDRTITAERVENDIYEAKFDLNCIGSQTCDLHRQNEGN